MANTNYTYKEITPENISYSGKVSSTGYVFSNNQDTFLPSGNPSIVINSNENTANTFLKIKTDSVNPNSPVDFTVSYGDYYGCCGLYPNNLTTPSTDEEKKQTFSKVNYESVKILIGQGNQDKIKLDDVNNNETTRVLMIAISADNMKGALYKGSLRLKFKNIDNNVDIFSVDNYVFVGDNNKNYSYIVTTDSNYEQIQNYDIIGRIYYDLGIIVLDLDKVSVFGNYPRIGFNSNCSSGNLDSNSDNIIDMNNYPPYIFMVQSLIEFRLLSIRNYYSIIYNINIKNSEYNYSTNASYADENGNILISEFIERPKVYVTTIGLYDENYRLIAIGRLSYPIVKTPSDNISFKVELTF